MDSKRDESGISASPRRPSALSSCILYARRKMAVYIIPDCNYATPSSSAYKWTLSTPPPPPPAYSAPSRPLPLQFGRRSRAPFNYKYQPWFGSLSSALALLHRPAGGGYVITKPYLTPGRYKLSAAVNGFYLFFPTHSALYHGTVRSIRNWLPRPVHTR